MISFAPETFNKNANEYIRVRAKWWEGFDLIDIRVWKRDGEGKRSRYPTKKGISIAVRLLPRLIALLLKIEQQLLRAGTLKKSHYTGSGRKMPVVEYRAPR